MATLEGVRATPLAPPGPTLRLTIMDAYILRELAAPFAFSAGVYMLFWYINIFFVAADYLINAHANIFLILRFLAFRVPQSIPMAFPFGCLFATLVAFGRMALKDAYANLTSQERDEREEFVVEACYLMRDRLRGKEVWETLGFPVEECLEYTDRSAFQQMFRSLLFTRIVPIVKDIGL